MQLLEVIKELGYTVLNYVKDKQKQRRLELEYSYGIEQQRKYMCHQYELQGSLYVALQSATISTALVPLKGPSDLYPYGYKISDDLTTIRFCYLWNKKNNAPLLNDVIKDIKLKLQSTIESAIYNAQMQFTMLDQPSQQTLPFTYGHLVNGFTVASVHDLNDYSIAIFIDCKHYY